MHCLCSKHTSNASLNTDNNETSVEIDLPREALCPIMVNDEEAPHIPIPPSSISPEDDIPDTYFNCFPPPFPSNSM